MALQHGDKAHAVDYAQRAVEAAPNDPQLWFLLGYASRLDSKYQQSADAYRRGLRLNPAALDGQSGLAQVLSLSGQAAEAERLLNEVIRADPSRRDDVQLLGEIYMRSKDYPQAVDWLTRAENSRPDVRSELMLAICYRQLNEPDQSNRYLNMAERRAPNNPEVERTMAGYYREAGKYSDAIAALKAIRNPAPDIMAELAYTYQLDGKLADSAQLYREAANAEPKDLTLQLSAAQAVLTSGSIDEAGPFLKRAESIDPRDYRLHAVKGEIAGIEDRDQDAVREYTSALAAMPANPTEGPLYGIQLHMDLVALDRSLDNDSAARQELGIAQDAIRAVESSGADKEQFLRLRSLIRLNSDDLDGAMSDIKAALAIDRDNRSNLQLDGDILMKLGHTSEAIAVYRQVLAGDPDNRLALASMGYALRAAGNNAEAESYFEHWVKVEPSSPAAYLARGDLQTAMHQFAIALASYSKAYDLAPHNSSIVAGGINAGIEAHKLDTAKVWFTRVTGDMLQNPQVLREQERYLSFAGKYAESAETGRRAIEFLPRDRDVVVYLGYDLLHEDSYDDLLDLTSKYWDVLPKEPDIPLLAGYVHKSMGLKEDAIKDFTEALKRDSSVLTAHVNRGYLWNDLRQPQSAANDFEEALKREPGNGEALLGLAYADLGLHKAQSALQQADLAERASGDSRDLHVIRATAYGLEDMLAASAREYRTALKFTPNDGELHLGLANTYFSARHYHEAIDELQIAAKLSPQNAEIYASLARSWASLHDRNRTIQYLQLAEARVPPSSSAAPGAQSEWSRILLSDGEALSTLGDHEGALMRFEKALETPRSDRVGVRLAIAQIMAQQGRTQEAERQIALAWMEAATGETEPPSWNETIAAADLFRSMHNYELSQIYLQRAKAAGAPDAEVRIGLANTYIAVGDTAKAKAELSAGDDPPDNSQDFRYLLAKASLLRQEQENAQALTAFAEAASTGGEDETAEDGMLETAANEGLRISPALSLLSDFSVTPIFEDSTVYVLDSKLDAAFAVPSTDVAQLPPPRSSIQTQWTDAFHLHLSHLPAAGGFFQVRNARGSISVPSTNSVIDRNTTDSTLNFALSPTIHLGDNTATFNGGVQGTIRRDSSDAVDIDQNLFRVFTYLNTSTFFNVLSINGYALREAGPFTLTSLHSREYAAALNFRVGAPWGRTALITGWGVDDQLFRLEHVENYYTSSYAGIDRKFSRKLDVQALAEDLRAWRIFGSRWGIAQNLRPAGTVDFTPKRRWDVQFTSAYSSNRGFHVYNATQNGISVSYSTPLSRIFTDPSEGPPVSIRYPIRFSAGVQQETFFNFSSAQNQQYRPYMEITLF